MNEEILKKLDVIGYNRDIDGKTMIRTLREEDEYIVNHDFDNIEEISNDGTTWIEEYPEMSPEYKKFSNEFSKLTDFIYDDCIFDWFDPDIVKFKIVRIDLVINLFNRYLFNDDLSDIKIESNISFNDYRTIAEYFIKFLQYLYLDIDYHNSLYFFKDLKEFALRNINENITEKEFLKKLNNVVDYYTSYNQSFAPHSEYLINYHDMIIDFVYNDYISFCNPFNSSFIKLLFKLVKFLEKYSISIEAETFDMFLFLLLMKYNMSDELFEFYKEHLDYLDYRAIKFVNNKESARMVYNYLNSINDKINYYNIKLDYYYDTMITIIKSSSASYFKNIYERFNDNMTFNSIYSKFDYCNELYSNIYSFYKYDYIQNDNGDLSYTYYTDDLVSEDKLRILYYEIGTSFDELRELFKELDKASIKLGNINDFNELLRESEEQMDYYAIEEIHDLFSKYSSSEEYNSDNAENYLREDFKNVNIDPDLIIDQINRYSKVKKVLLSASYIWHIYTNNDNMNVDKDGQDYTSLVANYFKAVEILLFRRIKDKYRELISNNVTLLKPYTPTGKSIDLARDDDNDITLGTMLKYLKREKKLINDESSDFIETLEIWIDNIRNSHLHKDLILTKTKTIEIKSDSLIMIYLIIKNI